MCLLEIISIPVTTVDSLSARLSDKSCSNDPRPVVNAYLGMDTGVIFL